MGNITDHMATSLETWADKIEEGHIFITPDELNCAAVLRVAATMLQDKTLALRIAVEALEYHTQQTRPIYQTEHALQHIKKQI